MVLLGGHEACPCGSGAGFDACCRPALLGAAPETAEALMRSRYTAFAVGDRDHLWRTWHPRTRPAEVTLDPTVRWAGLDVRATTGGGAEDEAGTVTFAARFVTPGGEHVLVEHSRFVRRGGRWVYVDGDQPD